MKNVRRPNVFGNFDRRAAKLRVTLCVVGIIFSAGSVESLAVKIGRIIHEEIPHAADKSPVRNCGKAQPRASHGNRQDRKSTRLNSSHEWISYAVFCLKKKKKTNSTIA